MMKKKILVIEDDPGIVDSLQIILENAGYFVDVSFGKRIIEKVEENEPDLILMDIWMSGVDGSEMCRYLKSREKTKHIPIIILSANKDTRTIAEDAGADDFIEKPFHMQDLLKRIKKYST